MLTFAECCDRQQVTELLLVQGSYIAGVTFLYKKELEHEKEQY